MFKEILNSFKNKERNEKTTSVFDEIQDDILGATDLSLILRKAKVLAYKLKNQEFKDWVEHELNGYDENDLLPEYRKIHTQSCGNFVNSAWSMKDAPIPTHNIPEKYREYFQNVNMLQGIKELESLVETLRTTDDDRLQSPLAPEILPLLNETIYQYMNCIGAWRIVTK